MDLGKIFQGAYFIYWLLVLPATAMYGLWRHLLVLPLFVIPVSALAVYLFRHGDVRRRFADWIAALPHRRIDRLPFLAASVTIAVLQIAGQVYFASEMAVEPRSDRLAVYRAAVTLADSGGWSLPLGEDFIYFLRYGNNLPVLAVTAALFKFLGRMGLVESAWLPAYICLNIAAIDAAIAMTAILARRRYGRAGALCLQGVCLFSMPLYTFTVFVYTDSLALPFTAGGLLAYDLLCGADRGGRRVPAFLAAVALGLSACGGYFMKPTAAIALIACGMCLAADHKARFLVPACGAFLAGLLVCNACLDSLAIVDRSYEDAYKFPPVHWVMMGLGDALEYSRSDAEYTASLDGYEGKVRGDLDVIRSRLESRGIPGTLFHLYRKAAYLWGDGEYLMELHLSAMPLKDSWLARWFHADTDSIQYHLQGLYTSALHTLELFLVALSLRRGMRSGGWGPDMAWKLCLMGLCGFLLFWEVQPRYLFHFFPAVVLTALDGWSRLGPIEESGGTARIRSVS